MGKLEKFKARAAEHGQAVTLYRFGAHPSGSYVDSVSGYPDPESAAYPATVPADSYGTPVTVQGFVQPPWSLVRGGQSYERGLHGEELPVDLIFFGPGDVTIMVRDRLVISGSTYEVNRVTERKDGETAVLRTCYLAAVEA